MLLNFSFQKMFPFIRQFIPSIFSVVRAFIGTIFNAVRDTGKFAIPLHNTFERIHFNQLLMLPDYLSKQCLTLSDKPFHTVLYAGIIHSNHFLMLSNN